MRNPTMGARKSRMDERGFSRSTTRLHKVAGVLGQTCGNDADSVENIQLFPSPQPCLRGCSMKLEVVGRSSSLSLSTVTFLLSIIAAASSWSAMLRDHV